MDPQDIRTLKILERIDQRDAPVNAILPGTHKTSRIDQLVKFRAEKEGKSQDAILQEMMTANPTHSLGDPSDFGAAAAFLASRQARFITGMNLLVDGGNYRGLL